MKIESYDKVVDLKEDENKKIARLKEIVNNDDFLREIVKTLVPHIAYADANGHSSYLPSIRLHPAFHMALIEQYDKVNVVVKKFPHKADYIRYLLTVGLVFDKWLNEIEDEESMALLRQLYEINKYHTKVNLQREAREYAEKIKDVKLMVPSKEEITNILQKIEKIV